MKIIKFNIRIIGLCLLAGFGLLVAACDKGCKTNGDSTTQLNEKIEKEADNVKKTINDYEERLMIKWDNIKNDIKKEWKKLSENAIEGVDGAFNKLSKELQNAYDVSKNKADKMIKDFMDKNK